MNFQDASNLQIPEGYVRTIHDKNSRLLWGSVGYDVSFDGNATQGELPSQYRQVEYVEATGTQYVNTGVSIASAGAQWSATIDMQYTATASSSQIMLGTGTSAGGWAGQNGGFYALGPTNRTTYASTQRVQAYVTFGTSASITIESETVTRAGSVPGGSVYLLAAANGDFACEAKLYSCKIYNASNVLVRDFVPCVRKSDSVAGLYDMVSMAFYASNGADAFNSGPNSPTPSTPVPVKTVQGEQNILITGKNLFNITPRKTGDGYYNNNTGVYVDNSYDDTLVTYETTNNGLTATILTAWKGLFFTSTPLETGTQYHFKWDATSTGNVRASVYALDGSFIIKRRIGNYTGNPTSSNANITLQDGEMYIGLWIGSNIANDVVTISQPQIELGSQATSYEVFAEQDFEVNLVGKNLYIGSPSFDGYTQANSWVEDGTYDGLPVYKRSGAWSGAYKEINVEAGNYYTFSVWIKSDEERTVGIYHQGGTATTSSLAKTFTTTTSWAKYSNTIYCTGSGTMRFRVENSTSITDSYTYVAGYQLEKGTQPTTYAPYFTPIELAKIGTYQDRIYKEGEKWYVEKQVGKVTFNGSETIESIGSNQCYRFNVTNALVMSGVQTLTPIESDYYTSATPADVYYGNVDYGVSLDNTASKVRIHNKDCADKTALATWLASNPTTVYYALATPTTTEITNEALIAQLEAVYDWVRRYGYNASVTGDLPIIISRTTL